MNYIKSACLKFSHLGYKQKTALNLAVFAFPLVFTIGAILLKIVREHWYYSLLVQEDGPGENLTAIVYFLSFLISLNIARKYFKEKQFLYGVMYSILSLGLFFIAMEEISWGQRIFGIQTPKALDAINYQHELNFHNIQGFPLEQAFIFVGLYGSLTRFICSGKIWSKYNKVVTKFVPDGTLFFYFFIVAILYLYYNYLSTILVSLFGDRFGWGPGHFIKGKDQEPAELLLSFGFLIFLIKNMYWQIMDQGGCDRAVKQGKSEADRLPEPD